MTNANEPAAERNDTDSQPGTEPELDAEIVRDLDVDERAGADVRGGTLCGYWNLSCFNTIKPK